MYNSESFKDTSLFLHFLDKIQVPTLSDGQKEQLDQPLSHAEVTLAISAMQNGKVGFHIDFLQEVFWSVSPPAVRYV